MATAQTVSVDPGGGGDYTSLYTALTTEDKDISQGTGTDDNFTFECSDSSGTPSGDDWGNVQFDFSTAWVTDESNDNWVKVIGVGATGAATPDWDASKYWLIQSSTTNWHEFTIAIGAVYIERLQIDQTGDTDSGISISATSTDSIKILGCHLLRSGSGTSNNRWGIEVKNSDDTIIVNNIISGNWVYGIGSWWAGGNPGGNVVYNNTIIDALSYGFGLGTSGADWYVKNNLIEGSGTADYRDVGTYATTATNWGENDSPDGTDYEMDGTPPTPTWEDAANDDYHLASGDDGDYEGTDLSADGQYAFSTDMEGDTRSDWDAGADEYVVAGGGGGGLPVGSVSLLGVGI